MATRADIIDKLFNTFLMEKKDKDIHVTAKGRQLLELVPEDLKKPALTADWEKKLMAISEGRLKKDVFIRDIRGYTEEIVSEIRTGDGKFRHENLTNSKVSSVRQANAVGQGQEQPDACVPGQGVRLSGDGGADDQCPLPEMS